MKSFNNNSQSTSSMHLSPLVSLKRLFIWLCMYPDETESKVKKAACATFAILVFTILVGQIVACFVYFEKFVRTDLIGSLFAFMTVSGTFCSAYIMATAFVFRHKLSEIFDKLATIYSANKDADSFHMLARANSKSEWIWRAYCILMIGSIASVAQTSIASVFFCWFNNGSFDVDSLYHLENVILPWDQTSLLGYLGESCFILIYFLCYLIANGAFLLLLISMCIHHEAFYGMIRHSIDNLGHGDGNRCDKQFLCDLIRFHISVKEWFSDSVRVYSPFVMVQLICNVIGLSIDVFILDLQIHQIDYTVSTVIAGLLCYVSNLFIYCYFGERSTESFEKMSDSLNDINWFELPIELQKYVILMTADMQKPLHYHGFGMAKLSLNTFINLIRTVISYYMIFKTLTSE